MAVRAGGEAAYYPVERNQLGAAHQRMDEIERRCWLTDEHIWPVRVEARGRPAPLIRRVRSGAEQPSRTGSLVGSDPRARGQACENTPASEPVPGPRTGGSLPPRTVPPLRCRPACPRKRKTLPRQRIGGKLRVNRRGAEV